MTTQNERTERLVSNLPTFMQLDSDSNNYKFLNSFSPELNVTESGIQLLRASLRIDEAIGDDLDLFAKLFELSRNTDENDVAFRGRIKAFFQTAIKSGSEIGLKESLANALGIEQSDITIVTDEANIFYLQIAITVDTDLSIFNGVNDIVNFGKAAGMYYDTRKGNSGIILVSANNIFMTQIGQTNYTQKVL